MQEPEKEEPVEPEVPEEYNQPDDVTVIHFDFWFIFFTNQNQINFDFLFSSTQQTGIAGQLANLDVSKPIDDFERKKNWEAGHIDYMGVDSFDNIQKKLDEAIGK